MATATLAERAHKPRDYHAEFERQVRRARAEGFSSYWEYRKARGWHDRRQRRMRGRVS